MAMRVNRLPVWAPPVTQVKLVVLVPQRLCAQDWGSALLAGSTISTEGLLIRPPEPAGTVVVVAGTVVDVVVGGTVVEVVVGGTVVDVVVGGTVVDVRRASDYLEQANRCRRDPS